MSELIRNWLLGITAASMLLALAESMVPEGINRKVASLAGGLVLVIAAVSPILKLDDRALERATEKFQTEFQNGSEKLDLKKEFLFESIIEEETEAYILDKAKEMGMNCQVSVSVAWNEEVPIPHSVSVRGTWTPQQKNELSIFLETELGVLKSLQKFEETDE